MGVDRFPANYKYSQQVMTGWIINNHWNQCVEWEHLPLHELIVKELNFSQTQGIFNHLTYADLNEVIEMIVAERHVPCMYERKVTDIITTVEHALNLCQINKNTCVQRLNSAVQYFHSIGRSDLLELHNLLTISKK